MTEDRINVAIVGLGFGTQFIPIYKRHPQTNMYAVCRRSRAGLDAVGNAFGVERRYERFDEVLADPDVDCVHINSPLTDHGWMSIAALKAGKHVMCTVPMAVRVEECEEIVRLVRETGLKDMMAETVLYSREYFYAKELHELGRLGRIQFLQGSHHQEWTAGQACRRCSMRRIASRPASDSSPGRPNMSRASAETQAFFGWLAMFAGRDMPASSAQTRRKLGWGPTGPGLIADLERLQFAEG